MTAVHIINRLPSAALKFRVPYEVLMGEKVNYEELKTFGCLAVAYNSTRGTDKFVPRGVLCAILGYPRGTKGYRLLNLENMQTFVSRHVKFHEQMFPRTKTHQRHM